MDKFEYKVLAYDPKGFFGGSVVVSQIENQLNQLGEEGWEMVIHGEKFANGILQGE